MLSWPRLKRCVQYCRIATSTLYSNQFFFVCKQVTDDLESQVKQNKKMLESQQAMEKELGLKRIEVSRLNTDNGLLQKKV